MLEAQSRYADWFTGLDSTQAAHIVKATKAMHSPVQGFVHTRILVIVSCLHNCRVSNASPWRYDSMVRSPTTVVMAHNANSLAQYSEDLEDVVLEGFMAQENCRPQCGELLFFVSLQA